MSNLRKKSKDSDSPAENVKFQKKAEDSDIATENVKLKKKPKDSDIPAENVKIKKKSKKSTPVKESDIGGKEEDLEEELEPGEIRPPNKPIIRESKLVLNEKLLERLRKPEKQVEFYQAIQKSMQSAAEYPPKLVQGVSSMINPAGTALVEDIGDTASL